MKKVLVSIICVVLIFSFTSCGNTEAKKQEVASMFDSFDQSEGVILLTCFELVVNGTHYDLNDIIYNEQQCNIIFLEENGFYSYVYDQDNLSVEFLYTHYATFEATSLGSAILPEKIINAFWGDDCFWFRIDDPDTEEFGQIYYSWCVNTNQADVIGSLSDEYEYSLDSNRSTRYSFTHTSVLGNQLEITDNESGITKIVNGSVLDTFEEGKCIQNANSSTIFTIKHAFEENGIIYLVSFFGVDLLGEPCYCYVYTWDFETEECAFYSAVQFDTYQEWVTDMYIK